jgi:hypothetical protein
LNQKKGKEKMMMLKEIKVVTSFSFWGGEGSFSRLCSIIKLLAA